MTITIGTKIKLLRALFGMSQINLARQLEISQSQLHLIENGRNPIPLDESDIQKIRKVFNGIDLDDPRIEQFAKLQCHQSIAAIAA